MSRENPYEELKDEELLNKLEEAEMFALTLESPQWGWFREACRRIHDEADRKLNVISPTDTAGIIQCQITKRFYKTVLPTVIAQMHQKADLAYHNAKARGLVNHFFEKIRATLGALSR